ncbi:hypothetical protein BBP40_002899 [Aspergillus hancockii]|nr:hypothetical protein BBP40_002899 [Aspergillus hancockii]
MLMLIYYLPIWLWAIKGRSTVQSCIDTLPLVLSLVAGSTLYGQPVGPLGYYNPFTMASSCLMPVGAGLICTFKINTTIEIWVGYQIILGFGISLGMQQASIAVLLVVFCQQLRGTIFV